MLTSRKINVNVKKKRHTSSIHQTKHTEEKKEEKTKTKPPEIIKKEKRKINNHNSK